MILNIFDMAECYCGLRTTANRWKWTCFGVLLVFGFVFLFAAFQQIATCSRSLEVGTPFLIYMPS